MDARRLATARILRFLEREPIVWLSTVRPDGGPHLVPIWFWWDASAVVVYSKPDAQKVRNLRANPSVMLALGDAEDDFDIGLVRGHAQLLATPTGQTLTGPFLEKYADRVAALGLTAETFARTYSQVIRIVPDVFLDWHGRTTPSSVRISGAPKAPMNEPRRGPDGEPVSRRGPHVLPRIVPPFRAADRRIVGLAPV
jgi:PPOX class probable F420-dependent enzyme